ncbi:hypothetical protein [Streptomyces coffeae]|uniref:hypothetical protein n=1 Tax=Streptomyces coffeae TaxID=621382 RepID=UPI001F336519|nr:hypothetical protein [Streptomyces coffeae]
MRSTGQGLGPAAAPEGLPWPGEGEPPGVGGPALTAARGGEAARSLRRALEAVTDWSRRPLGAEAIRTFPYDAIAGYYRQVGKAAAAPELVALLRGARARLLCAGPPRAWSSPDAWLLDKWLPLTFADQAMAYDSYAGHELLEIAEWEGADPAAAEDVLLATLLAELAVVESEALLGAGPAARQRTRTTAVLRALARLGEFAPRAVADAGPLAEVRALRAALAAAPGDRPPAGAGRDAAAAIRDRAPLPVRRAVDIALLPVTTLHDEYMFIRCIQLFERLFTQVARAQLRAVDAVRLGRVPEAVDALDGAELRLSHATGPLYRVLTTMPPEAFAVIREYTHGASAIQSQSYRLVERCAAPRKEGAYGSEKGPQFTLVTTLQEEYLEHAGDWDAADAARLEAVMRRLDTTWQAMKRTHWGVTLKIIGKASGTGGTTGAEYLKAAADVPLFPLLTA